MGHQNEPLFGFCLACKRGAIKIFETMEKKTLGHFRKDEHLSVCIYNITKYFYSYGILLTVCMYRSPNRDEQLTLWRRRGRN